MQRVEAQERESTVDCSVLYYVGNFKEGDLTSSLLYLKQLF